jgi:predicted Ser/Thr protein kinase
MSVCLADRVEHLRRQLAVNSNTSAQDMESIQTVELLGEGTFGKVYKGLWRGSTVAVSGGCP